MPEIPLTKNRVALVDDDDFAKLSAHCWYFNTRGYAVRAVCVSGRRQSWEWMHRVVIDAPDDLHVDHINGDKLDNRRENLRLATPAQNRANTRLDSRNVSGFKGVTWNKAVGRWVARIGYQGRNRWLGSFTDPVEAAHAYDRAAVELYGPYCKPNFPEVEPPLLAA